MANYTTEIKTVIKELKKIRGHQKDFEFTEWSKLQKKVIDLCYKIKQCDNGINTQELSKSEKKKKNEKNRKYIDNISIQLTSEKRKEFEKCSKSIYLNRYPENVDDMGYCDELVVGDYAFNVLFIERDGMGDVDWQFKCTRAVKKKYNKNSQDGSIWHNSIVEQSEANFDYLVPQNEYFMKDNGFKHLNFIDIFLAMDDRLNVETVFYDEDEIREKFGYLT